MAGCEPRALRVSDRESGNGKTSERNEWWKPPAAVLGDQPQDSVFPTQCITGFRLGPNVGDERRLEAGEARRKPSAR